jgi:hypothetical protein
MKTLTIISTLIFTVMFSSPSFADWKKVVENVKGTTFYVDFERIRKHGGYVYFWYLTDLLKPDKDGDLSYKIYNQGDCKLFRHKYLSISLSKEPMGGGTGKTFTYNDNNWIYPPPGSSGESILKSACSK